jgi:hypothetical protein
MKQQRRDGLMAKRTQIAKALMRASMLCLLGLLMINSGTWAETLRIATDKWVPYENLSDPAAPGFSTEVLKAVFASMDIDITIEEYPWKRALHEVYNGKSDALYSGFWSEERAQYCYFPQEPLIQERWVLFIEREHIGTLTFSFICMHRKKDARLLQPLFTAEEKALENTGDAKALQIKLKCCHGHPAPAPVVDGWRQFLQFPESAGKAFWSLLGPVLFDPANPANKQRIDAFSKQHVLGEETLAAAIHSCGFLLRQAASLDLDAAEFKQDLASLSGEDQSGAQAMIDQYQDAKAGLRKLLVQESLADHGKVLVGMDWRMDTISASSRGAKLDTAIVLLTLKYRDNNRIERTTLQLTPEAIRELKRFTDRFSEQPVS